MAHVRHDISIILFLKFKIIKNLEFKIIYDRKINKYCNNNFL